MFLLFSGEVYYPGGGAYDFIGFFATVDEAKSKMSSLYKKNYGEHEWAQIVTIDGSKMKVIYRFFRGKWEEVSNEVYPKE